MIRTTSVKDYLKAYHTVTRMEYAPAEVPAIVFPLILGISALTDLLSFAVIEGFLIFLFLILAGFIVNSLEDRDIDKKYGTFKGDISNGVDVLGVRGTRMLLWSHVAAAFALTIHLTWWTGDIWFLVLVSIGAFLGIGYSLKPFHFKVKGWLHAVSLGISGYFIPFVFLYHTASGDFLPINIMFIFCLTVAHYSLALTNQCADAKEDLDEGLLTPGARWGLSRTLWWSRTGTALGMTLAVLMLYYFFINSGLPWFGGADGAGTLNPLVAAGLLAAVTGIMLAAYSIPLKGQHDLFTISKLQRSMDERSRMIKDRINFHGWHAAGVSGVVSCLILLLALNTAFGPADDDGLTGGLTTAPAGMDIAGVTYTYTYSDDGALYRDAKVYVANASGDTDPSDFHIQGFSYTAGETYDRTNVTMDDDWEVTVSLRLHDAEDTSFSFQLTGPEGAVGNRWMTPPVVDLYIVEAGVQESTELIGGDSIVVSIWNDGPARAPGTVSVTLQTNRLADPLTEESVEYNDDTIPANSDWTAVFTLDLLETVEDYEVTLEMDGFQVDYLAQETA